MAFTVACLIALVVLAALLLTKVSVGSDSASAAGIWLTLLFGLYGPSFLWLTQVVFGRFNATQLRTSLRRSDERSPLIQLMLLGGPKSWATLIVIIGIVSVLLLATGGAQNSRWLLAACVLCVLGTWVLLVAVFAVEYMRSWANEDSLQFPGDDEATFADFLYLSVQLSTTFSSSDVELVKTSARRLATVHAIVAFAYSTVIIAVFASLVISVNS